MHERRFGGDISRLRSPERVRLLEVDRVVDLCLDKLTVKNALDIGTGSGLFAEAFAKRGLTVSGVDANSEMVAAARQFVPQGTFQEGLAEKLPFPDAAFDLTFLGMVLHETDDPLQALREVRRVTKSRIAILEWPYEIQEFGPPLEDRLKPNDIDSLLREVGLTPVTPDRLAHLILYRLNR